MKKQAYASFDPLIRESSKIKKSIEFLPNWFFDKKNYSIYGENKLYFLTKKELLFFTMLLEDRIVTYSEMHNSVWLKKEDVTQNAMCSFVKNFKKKIPENILRNIYGVGYMIIK